MYVHLLCCTSRTSQSYVYCRAPLSYKNEEYNSTKILRDTERWPDVSGEVSSRLGEGVGVHGHLAHIPRKGRIGIARLHLVKPLVHVRVDERVLDELLPERAPL